MRALLQAFSLQCPLCAGMRTGAECWFFEAVAALSLFLGRLSVPESQAWLAAVRRGGVRTAGVRLQDNRADWLRLLAAPENRFGFFFSSGFWLCQTIPATIMMLYSPAILGSLSAGGDAVAQMLLFYGFFVAGILPSGAKYFAGRPRSVLLGTFLAMLAGLTGVVLFRKSYSKLLDVFSDFFPHFTRVRAAFSKVGCIQLKPLEGQ